MPMLGQRCTGSTVVDEPQPVQARASISGRVQGVFYRVFTRDEALALGLTGWVRNLPDGRVEALFEGSRDAVERMLVWCRRGSPASRVLDVRITWGEAHGFDSFVIRP
jgi:acylphosphatase